MPARQAWDGVLVRFGEIGIKSAPVRRAMVDRLRDNLLATMLRLGVEGDVALKGTRLWMTGHDADGLVRAATHTFGVVSASPCRVVPSTMESMTAAAAEVAFRSTWTTFAIRARREGNHAYSSQDVQIQCGNAVYRAAEAAGRAPKVDLTAPELQLHIDIRAGQAFVFTHAQQGPGGLPMGSQGTVLALLSNEASFVAAWMMMRRGCLVRGLHAGTTGSGPTDGVDALAAWGLPRELEVLPICSGRIAKATLLQAAATVAADVGAAALVTGDTLRSTLVPGGGLAVPVLRPVCGLDPNEYAAVRGQAGLAGLPDADEVVHPDGKESLDSALSMRRTVTL